MFDKILSILAPFWEVLGPLIGTFWCQQINQTNDHFLDPFFINFGAILGPRIDPKLLRINRKNNENLKNGTKTMRIEGPIFKMIFWVAKKLFPEAMAISGPPHPLAPGSSGGL